MASTRAPQQQRSKQTVAAIIEAGFISIARDGVDGLSTRKVADIAGVSVGTLYEYFANKEAIQAAMNEQLAADVVRMIRPMIPELVRMMPRDVVLALLFALRELLSRHQDRYLHYARTMVAGYEDPQLEPIRRVLGELAVQYLAHNPKYVRMTDIPVKAYIMIQGGMATLIHQLSQQNPVISFEQLANGLADMVRDMLDGGLRRPSPTN